MRPSCRFIIAAVVALAACSDGGTTPTVVPVRVDVSGLPDTAGVGDTLAPVLRFYDRRGVVVPDSTPRLSSSAPDVIAVLPGNRLRALTTGRAFVRAEAGGARDSALVTVERLARGLRIVLDADSAFVGELVAPRAVLVDGIGATLDSARTVTWTVSDTSVLQQRAFDAVLGAVGDGSADVVATSGSLTTRQSIRVRLAPPLATPLPDGGAPTDVGAAWPNGCTRSSLGNVYCWGRAATGLLGNGLSAQTTLPTRATSPVSLGDVQLTLSAACARGPAADVYCWGFEPLLTGTSNTITQVPQRIALPDSIGPVAELVPSGPYDRCLRATSGSLFCWGFNTNAAIGPRVADDSTAYRVRRLAGVPPFVRAAIGERAGCGVTGAGALWCWGFSDGGYQPDATTPTSESPQLVPTPRPVVDVAVAYRSVCTIDDQGAIDCWGFNYFGAVGVRTAGAQYLGRTRVAAPGRFVRIRAAGAGVCALADAGALWCWGNLRHRGEALPLRLSREHTFSTFSMGIDGTYAVICGITTTQRVVCNQRWFGS